MSLLFDSQRLEKLLADFYFATGVSMDVLRDDMTSVDVPLYGYKAYCDMIKDTREGRLRCDEDNRHLIAECRKSRKTAVEVCHAGLIHVAVPVISEGELIAYLVLGRFRQSEKFTLADSGISELPLNFSKLEDSWSELLPYGRQKISSSIALAEALAKYMVSEKILKTVKNDNLERVVQYIKAHLSEELNVENISRATSISKSVIYRNFNTHLGMTVSEYININRIDESCLILKKTDLSIDEIAHRVGFKSAAYYVSVFKQRKGTTPLQWRKRNFLKVDNNPD